jgi:hypothetical protein
VGLGGKTMVAKLKIAVLIIGTVVFVVAVVQAWRAQAGTGQSCSYGVNHRDDYIEIDLRHQEPVEPVFLGELYYRFYEDPKTEELTVTRSGAEGSGITQGYGPTQFSGQVVKRSERYFLVGPMKDFHVIPISGSHRYFPFDSATFDFRLDTQPPVEVGRIQVVNRVEGFVFGCATGTASRVAAGAIKLHFTLHRNPLTQLSTLVLAGASVAFGILILQSKTIESLSGSAASSFFSLWTVRSILSSQIHVFPTLLDLIMLTAGMGLLVLMLWRVIMGANKAPRDDVPV